MKTTVRIDSTGFRAMARELSKISGKSYEHILKDQGGKVLEIAIARTPMAKAKDIHRRSKKGQRIEGVGLTLTVNSGAKGGVAGRVWVRNHRTGKYHNMTDPRNRLGPSGKPWPRDFSRHSERLRRILKKETSRKLKSRLAARGLARQSWLQIAERGGLPIRRIAGGQQVRRATSQGRRPRLGTFRRVGSGSGLYLELVNLGRLMHSPRIKGPAILSGALNQRRRGFNQDMRKGVFQDIATRAKRYPGIFTQ